MKQVKLFKGTNNIDDLTKKVNEWISDNNNDVDIIDIRSSCTGNYDTTIVVMVYYDKKKNYDDLNF